jgi:hypothetical protein
MLTIDGLTGTDISKMPARLKSAGPTIIIQRNYEPDPEPLDRVVEILYRLLAEIPDGHTQSSETGLSEAPLSNCVSGECE